MHFFQKKYIKFGVRDGAFERAFQQMCVFVSLRSIEPEIITELKDERWFGPYISIPFLLLNL